MVMGSAVCAVALYCVVVGEGRMQGEESGGEVYVFVGIFVCMFAVAATQGPLTWVYVA